MELEHETFAERFIRSTLRDIWDSHLEIATEILARRGPDPDGERDSVAEHSSLAVACFLAGLDKASGMVCAYVALAGLLPPMGLLSNKKRDGRAGYLRCTKGLDWQVKQLFEKGVLAKGLADSPIRLSELIKHRNDTMHHAELRAGYASGIDPRSDGFVLTAVSVNHHWFHPSYDTGVTAQMLAAFADSFVEQACGFLFCETTLLARLESIDNFRLFMPEHSATAEEQLDDLEDKLNEEPFGIQLENLITKLNTDHPIHSV